MWKDFLINEDKFSVDNILKIRMLRDPITALYLED